MYDLNPETENPPFAKELANPLLKWVDVSVPVLVLTKSRLYWARLVISPDDGQSPDTRRTEARVLFVPEDCDQLGSGRLGCGPESR